MHRHPHTSLLLLVVCCASVCLAAEPYQCTFDDVVKRGGPQTIAVVKEVPPNGQNGWQAYTLSATVGEESEWKPIRILVSTEDLKDPTKYCNETTPEEKKPATKSAKSKTAVALTAEGTEERTVVKRPDFQGRTVTCKEADLLTAQRKADLADKILPAAVKLHTDRLLVKRLAKPFIVPKFDEKSMCSKFKVPDDHRAAGKGVNADMVLYVAAGPGAPFALPCAVLDSQGNGRPVAGVMNFPPSGFRDLRLAVRIAAHEIAHALGFTNRRMVALNMVSYSVARGRNRPMVKSKMTLEKTKTHFGCNTAGGMELQEWIDGSVTSHWSRRNAKDELMSAQIGSRGGYYTALTLAAFEDMPYYSVNWSMAEPMAWGKDVGCGFLSKACAVEGLTKHPRMLCEGKKEPTELTNATLTEISNRILRRQPSPNKGVDFCTSDRLAVGRCSAFTGDVGEFGDTCPTIAPYLSSKGGSLVTSTCGLKQEMDLSALLAAPLPESNSWCLDTVASTSATEVSVTPPITGGVCANVKCIDGSKVQVQLEGSDGTKG
ncbi:surface protease GP63 [Trypanosoma grayi]|uniref:surface protease GP63 n=1 Tax=Trypanosoma grayi TaxID=71804 RepID=UPI0004F4BB0E|nr:surface protease GP63 [Trypanosoma grayi]KEG15352.1 surface protease GP63 [Trypanosoma grayi]